MKGMTYFYRAHTFVEYPACRCASTGYGSADVAVPRRTLYPLKQKMFFEGEMNSRMVSPLEGSENKKPPLCPTRLVILPEIPGPGEYRLDSTPADKPGVKKLRLLEIARERRKSVFVNSWLQG